MLETHDCCIIKWLSYQDRSFWIRCAWLGLLLLCVKLAWGQSPLLTRNIGLQLWGITWLIKARKEGSRQRCNWCGMRTVHSFSIQQKRSIFVSNHHKIEEKPSNGIPLWNIMTAAVAATELEWLLESSWSVCFFCCRWILIRRAFLSISPPTRTHTLTKQVVSMACRGPWPAPPWSPWSVETPPSLSERRENFLEERESLEPVACGWITSQTLPNHCRHYNQCVSSVRQRNKAISNFYCVCVLDSLQWRYNSDYLTWKTLQKGFLKNLAIVLRATSFDEIRFPSSVTSLIVYTFSGIRV